MRILSTSVEHDNLGNCMLNEPYEKRRIVASRFALPSLFCNNGLYTRDAILTRHGTRKGRERQRADPRRHGQSSSFRHIGTESDSQDLNWFRDKCVELKMHSDDHPRSLNPSFHSRYLSSTLRTIPPALTIAHCVPFVSFPSLSPPLFLSTLVSGESPGYRDLSRVYLSLLKN